MMGKRLVMAALAGAVTLCAASASRAGEGAGRLLEEQSKAQAIEEKAAVQRSRYFQEVGRRFLDEMKYAEARENLQKAVALDPQNKEAAQLLEKVNELLGVRMPQLRTALDRVAEERKVAVQEKLIELENCLRHGQKKLEEAMRGADPSLSAESALARQVSLADRAVEYAERAREIIKWMPYEVDVSKRSEEAEKLLAQARSFRQKKLADLSAEKIRSGQRQVEARKQEDKRIEERKIEKLLDQVQMHYDLEQYVDAERLAAEVLKLDRTNFRALELWLASRDQQHRKREQELRITRKEEKLLLDERIAEACVPHYKYIVYPEDWAAISQRESVQAQEAAEPEWKRDVRKMLDRKVTFEFVDTPLQEAIQFLQTLTKTTIILDPRAFEGGAGATTPITLRVNDMPLHLALKWILRLADLDYTLKNEAVFISTPKNLAGEVELKIYDVRDLTYQITQFPGPELIMTSPTGTTTGAAAGGPITIEEAAPEAVFQAGSLAELIMNRVMPGSWAPELGTSIEERSGKLVVMQKPEVHRLISQILKTFRESQTLQVMVQARFIEVRDSFLEDIGVDFADLPVDAIPGTPPPALPNPGWANPLGLHPDHPFYAAPAADSTGFIATRTESGVPAGEYDFWVRQTSFNNRTYPFGSRLPYDTPAGSGQGATFQFRFIGNVVSQAILHAVKKEEKGDLLLAPRITMYNNQRAHMMAATQRAFVADYDVSGAVYDPVVATIMTGTVLDVRPTVSHDRRYITLNMQPGTADNLQFQELALGGNVYSEDGMLVGTVGYVIQLPSIRLRSVRTTVTVPDGGTVLLSGLMTDVKYNAASGVPFFSDLPIVGRVFGSDLKQREKINLLIIVSTNLILFEEEEAKL